MVVTLPLFVTGQRATMATPKSLAHSGAIQAKAFQDPTTLKTVLTTTEPFESEATCAMKSNGFLRFPSKRHKGVTSIQHLH